jgi:hypothetical protein
MSDPAPSIRKLALGSVGALLVAGALIASIFMVTTTLAAAPQAGNEALLFAVLATLVVGLPLLGLGLKALGVRYGGAGSAAGTFLWLGAIGGVMVIVSVLAEARLLTVGLVLLTGGLGLGGLVGGIALFATPALGKVAGVCVLLAGGAWTFIGVAVLVPTLFATVVELHGVFLAVGIIGGAVGYLLAGVQMLRARRPAAA